MGVLLFGFCVLSEFSEHEIAVCFPFPGLFSWCVHRECLLLLNAESSSGTRRSRESKGGMDSGKGDYRWCFVAALLLGISLKDWMCCGNRESRKGLWQT